ncbi:pyridoxal 5'-phosphate synthase glutaminase subunit PdxT [Candidatus Poriferisodalis sp.]|uniref:pyridoxal 5'-phosphate synthase glutaminase subunit PdxT n=1 Tax=Candidatus Poriferisodalis sp. TaxID=3101277 RepID=UPI003B023001
MIGVVALQGAVGEHLAAFRRAGATAVEVRRPTDLEGVDAVALPGGESTTMSRLLATSGLFAALSDRLAEGMPAFGTCAGMILLASEVLDGRPDQRCFGAIDISIRRNAFGRQIASFEAELAAKGLDEPFHAVFIRAPWVERAGTGVEVLATLRPARRSPAGEAADDDAAEVPVLCRSGPILVSSFHPELTSDDRIHRMFLDMVRASSDASSAPPRDCDSGIGAGSVPPPYRSSS